MVSDVMPFKNRAIFPLVVHISMRGQTAHQEKLQSKHIYCASRLLFKQGITENCLKRLKSNLHIFTSKTSLMCHNPIYIFLPRTTQPHKKTYSLAVVFSTGNTDRLLSETLTCLLIFWLVQSITAVEFASSGWPADPGGSRETESRWSVEAQEELTKK